MGVNIEAPHKTLGRIHEALGLPDDFPIVSFHMDIDVETLATATITFRVRKEQAERIGDVLGEYNLIPKRKLNPNE